MPGRDVTCRTVDPTRPAAMPQTITARRVVSHLVSAGLLCAEGAPAPLRYVGVPPASRLGRAPAVSHGIPSSGVRARPSREVDRGRHDLCGCAAISTFRLTKENGSSWIFEPCLTCANALKRVQHPAFSLVYTIRRRFARSAAIEGCIAVHALAAPRRLVRPAVWVRSSGTSTKTSRCSREAGRRRRPQAQAVKRPARQ